MAILLLIGMLSHRAVTASATPTGPADGPKAAAPDRADRRQYEAKWAGQDGKRVNVRNQETAIKK